MVSGIVGLRQLIINFTGAQDHAGATAMVDRRDAAFAAMRFGTKVDELFREAALTAQGLVWTIGQLKLTPNAPSIVPGHARVLFQFRDEDEATLDALEAIVHEVARAAAPPCEMVCATHRNPVRAVPMDGTLQAHVVGAARKHTGADGWVTLPSGAVHDAANVARCMPASMLFVPSINGVSHDFTEDTHEDDIALGAQVYVSAAAHMLSSWRGMT